MQSAVGLLPTRPPTLTSGGSPYIFGTLGSLVGNADYSLQLFDGGAEIEGMIAVTLGAAIEWQRNPQRPSGGLCHKPESAAIGHDVAEQQSDSIWDCAARGELGRVTLRPIGFWQQIVFSTSADEATLSGVQ